MIGYKSNKWQVISTKIIYDNKKGKWVYEMVK